MPNQGLRKRRHGTAEAQVTGCYAGQLTRGRFYAYFVMQSVTTPALFHAPVQGNRTCLCSIRKGGPRPAGATHWPAQRTVCACACAAPAPACCRRHSLVCPAQHRPEVAGDLYRHEEEVGLLGVERPARNGHGRRVEGGGAGGFLRVCARACIRAQRTRGPTHATVCRKPRPHRHSCVQGLKLNDASVCRLACPWVSYDTCNNLLPLHPQPCQCTHA